MRRILLGAFGDVLGRAVRVLLDQVPDHIVVTSAERVTLGLLEDVRPDVMILDLDSGAILPALGELSRRFPQMAVIACSAEEPFMLVFPALRGGEYFGSVLSLDAFAAVVVDPCGAPATFPGPAAPGVTLSDDSSGAAPMPPMSWNDVALDAADLRLAAELLRARSRLICRQAAELKQVARREQAARGLSRDGGRSPTR